MEGKDEVSDTDSGIILQSGEWLGESRRGGHSPASPRSQALGLARLRGWKTSMRRVGGGGRGLCWGLNTRGSAVFLEGLAWRCDPIWNRALPGPSDY